VNTTGSVKCMCVSAEFIDLLYSADSFQVIRSFIMRWVENVARMGERRDACRVSVEEPEVNRQFGRSRHRWEDNMM